MIATSIRGELNLSPKYTIHPHNLHVILNTKRFQNTSKFIHFIRRQ